MQNYLYHVTEKKNVESILRYGLKPGGLSRESFAVYLSESPISWYKKGLAILQVYIKDLPSKGYKITTFLPESDEILVWGKIPPERIKLYNLSEEEKQLI